MYDDPDIPRAQPVAPPRAAAVPAAYPRAAPSLRPAPTAFGPRPAAVSVLVTLLLIAAVGALLLAVPGFVFSDGPGDPTLGLAFAFLLCALASGAAAYGAVVRAAWAWWLALGAAIVGVLLNLRGLYLGEITISLFGLALSAAILAVLFQRDVQAWLGVRLAGPPFTPGRPT